MNGALVIVVTTLILLFKLYGWRFVLHPASSFLVIWILSIMSFVLFQSLGGDYLIYHEEYLNELFGFVGFTAACVAVVNLFTFRKIKTKSIDINFNYYYTKLDKLIVVFVCAIGIIRLLALGTTDLVSIRAEHVEETVQIMKGGQKAIFDMVLGFILMFNLPYLLMSGMVFGDLMLRGRLRKIPWIYLLPFMTELVTTIYMGGRHNLVTAIMVLFIGILPVILSDVRRIHIPIKKVLGISIVLLISFSLYSTFVQSVRQEANKGHSYTIWDQNPYLSPFSGLLNYLLAHYPGYQLRRSDSYTEELEPGHRTLDGLRYFEVPIVSNIAGVSISPNLFLPDKKEVPKLIGEERESLLWSNTTATVYRLIIDDYGYFGAFIAIILFVILTQIVLIKFIKHGIRNLMYVVPFYLAHILWFDSIFSHHLSGDWFSMALFPFVIVVYVIRKIRI